MGNESSKEVKLANELTQEQLNYINKHTEIPNHEILHWYSRFIDFSNGKDLDKKIFVKYYKELLPSNGNPDAFCQLAFSAFDTNHNKKLDYTEIVIGFAMLYKPNLHNRLKWMFRLYDQNSDGLIDQKELKTAIRAVVSMQSKCSKNDESVDAIIDDIYLAFPNDNGNISQESFISGAKANKRLREIICPQNL